MASPVLHIKDSYYFGVPKALWRSDRQSRAGFPGFWVKLDPNYQLWEAERIQQRLAQDDPDVPDWPTLKAQYVAWKHADHSRFGRPFARFLESDPGQAWFQAKLETPAGVARWREIQRQAADVEAYREAAPAWSQQTIDAYNKELDGKILIPQPFGSLRNLYESEHGFCLSKFMAIELFVAIVLTLVFVWLGRRMKAGGPPRGRVWNMFEVLLLFIRDQVARPAIGKHDADRFVPLLWTVFLFILGCNLLGLVPWVGAPTGAFGTTFGLACVIFGTVIVFGIRQFGLIGFWKNLVPPMDLPLILAIPIVPMIFAIEVLGMCIRHAVLAIRLLANMVAGHLVILGILGLAFTLQAALSPNWWLAATIALTGSTLFYCLELFVAFLQAYIFTFLSALFIGAAIHHH